MLASGLRQHTRAPIAADVSGLTDSRRPRWLLGNVGWSGDLVPLKDFGMAQAGVLAPWHGFGMALGGVLTLQHGFGMGHVPNTEVRQGC